jgi:hypothetical protein
VRIDLQRGRRPGATVGLFPSFHTRRDELDQVAGERMPGDEKHIDEVLHRALAVYAQVED